MRESGRRSNHRLDVESLIETLMDVSDRQVRRRILKAAAVEKDRLPEPRAQLRLKQGKIQKALFRVMRDFGRPMSPRQATEAVSNVFGREISYDTVCSCMSSLARDSSSPIARVSTGLYAWRP